MANINELNEEQLEKVIGGYGGDFYPTSYHLNNGATFKYDTLSGTEYFMFNGASGEYSTSEVLPFICYVFYSGLIQKCIYNFKFDDVLNKHDYYKVCTEAELDAMLGINS